MTIRARPRLADAGGILWDGVVLDDTANRLIQLEIERSREEQRALSRHLQSVREEEKASIARELHDELGSTLTALKMDLDRPCRSCPAQGDAREDGATMARLIDTAVATTRRIVTDLRPSILDDLGLAVALRWQAGEYCKRSGTKIVVETPEPDIAVDRECALTLFRIFQETLTNVMRHANASRSRRADCRKPMPATCCRSATTASACPRTRCASPRRTASAACASARASTAATCRWRARRARGRRSW